MSARCRCPRRSSADGLASQRWQDDRSLIAPAIVSRPPSAQGPSHPFWRSELVSDADAEIVGFQVVSLGFVRVWRKLLRRCVAEVRISVLCAMDQLSGCCEFDTAPNRPSGQRVRKNRVYENVIVSKVGASNCNAASYIRHESVDGVAEASAQCCCIIDVHCMLISPGQSSRMTGTVE